MHNAIRWLSKGVALAVQEAQFQEHGGSLGVQSRDLLESAIARPVNSYSYGSSTIPELAANYAFGIIENYPFVDSNKRSGAILKKTADKS